jgi:hypothetical protein
VRINLFWQRHHGQLEIAFVAVLAGAVRLTSLGTFRAVDEEDRWAWAVDFFQALLAGDLAGTLVGDGYPGILPAWLETVWLLAAMAYRSVSQGSWIGEAGVYSLLHQWGRVSNLALQRFPVALTNTLLVVFIFLYVRRLFGTRVALVAAILISLDPFYLSDSRVNRAEALVTGLMMLALLGLIGWLRGEGRRHLLVSGVFGGLAMLTKSQAVVLVPVLGTVTLLWHLRNTSHWWTAIRLWFRTMLVWGLIVSVTFALLWPAVWTVPGPTFRLMLKYVVRKVGEEGVNLFFMGRTLVDEDPGPLFYPIIFVFRATPLMLLGLLGEFILAMRQKPWRTNWRLWLDRNGMWALMLYALLYTAGMTLGSHKQDRFLMAIFPVLSVLAARGLLRIGDAVWRRTTSVDLAGLPAVTAGTLLLTVQLVTVLPYHPYYYPYFNPLVGGGSIATRTVRIGWGEGMDQVAAYLNALADSDQLTVAARFYKYLVGFNGKAVNLDAGGDWLGADYIVFYIQQVQRMQDPSPGIIRYFQEHVSPEKIITLGGIDYAWVYRNPITFPASPGLQAVRGIRFLGLSWEPDGDGGAVARLLWENASTEGTAPPIYLRLWASDAAHTGWMACTPAPGFEEVARTPAEVVESVCALSPRSGLPGGLYNLQVGLPGPEGEMRSLEFPAGWSAVEHIEGQLSVVSREVAFEHLAQEGVPTSAMRTDREYADRVKLLAYQLSPPVISPGEETTLTLYWQPLGVLDQEAHVFVHAIGGLQETLLNVSGPPVAGTRPMNTWHPGEVIVDTWRIPFAVDAPAPALVRLDVGLYLPDTLQSLPVTSAVGEPVATALAWMRLVPEAWPTYSGDHLVGDVFGDAVRLLGYDVTSTHNNTTVGVTLYWEALDSVAEDYTVFVHLLGADGSLLAQSDVLPADGYYPTSAWQPDQVVLSHHSLQLPPDGLLEACTLLVGLYRPDDGVRLSGVGQDGQALPDDAASLGEVMLQ